MGWDRIGGQYGHFIGNLIARRVVSVRNCYLRIRGAGGPHRTSNDTLPSCHWLAVEWASGSIDPKETRTGTAKPRKGKESKGKCLCLQKDHQHTTRQQQSKRSRYSTSPLSLSLSLKSCSLFLSILAPSIDSRAAMLDLLFRSGAASWFERFVGVFLGGELGRREGGCREWAADASRASGRAARRTLRCCRGTPRWWWQETTAPSRCLSASMASWRRPSALADGIGW